LKLPGEVLLDSGQACPSTGATGAKCFAGAGAPGRPGATPGAGAGGSSPELEVAPAPASALGQQTRVAVFAEFRKEIAPPAEKEGTAKACLGDMSEKESAKPGNGSTDKEDTKAGNGSTSEKQDTKADLGLRAADDAAVALGTPETMTGNTEEVTASTSAASNWAPYGLASSGSAAPPSPDWPQFSKRINRTSLLFVSVPRLQANNFPAARQVFFVPRGADPDVDGFPLRVTCPRPPRGPKYLCSNWADFVNTYAIAVGDVLDFVMSRDNPFTWEFTVARQNLWAKPRDQPLMDDGDLRCLRCGRQDEADQLLLCDGPACGRACHLKCCRPELEEVPRGQWLCEVCEAGGPSEVELCMFCGRSGEVGELAACAGKDCGRSCHLHCSRPPLNEAPKGDWLCVICRRRQCIECGKKNEQAKMLLCDGEFCGWACHLRCLRPSITEAPEGEWFCKHCKRRGSAQVTCMECGQHHPDSPLLLCNSTGCQRACHLACCTPALKEVPSGPWFCSLCQCAGAFDAHCMNCNRRDGEARLLLCDGPGCTRACHLRCCKPPLKDVPLGDWFCEICVLKAEREREAAEAAATQAVCLACGSSDNDAELLLCDGPDCSNACHLRCCNPPLQRVPVGEWYCLHCQASFAPAILPPTPPAEAGPPADVGPEEPPSLAPWRAARARPGPARPSPKRKVCNESDPSLRGKCCLAFGDALKLAASTAVARPARPQRR